MEILSIHCNTRWCFRVQAKHNTQNIDDVDRQLVGMEYFRLSVSNSAFRKWKDIESFYKMKILSISRKRLRFEMKIAICDPVQCSMVLQTQSETYAMKLTTRKLNLKFC